MAYKNWTTVYTYFLSNEGTSYADISVKFNIPLGTIKDKAAREHWQEKRQKLITNAITQIETETKIKVVELKRQQAEFGKILQSRAAKALATGQIQPKNASEIARWIKAGVDIERRALEMDKTSFPKKPTLKTDKPKLL